MSRLERRLVHRSDLLAELQNSILPISLRVEPRECKRKSRIAPAPRDPRAVMNEAQAAQRFNEPKLASIEVVEILVTFEQCGELHLHRPTLARQQHPQVLNRGAHSRIVEVDKMRAIVGP